jgi:hypothetical protein
MRAEFGEALGCGEKGRWRRGKTGHGSIVRQEGGKVNRREKRETRNSKREMRSWQLWRGSVVVLVAP